MKKRVYKATKVKNLNIKELITVTKGKELLLSVDVAKEDFMAVIVDKNRTGQEIIATISWKHPLQTQLFYDLFFEKLEWKSLEVALEPTGVYGESLRYYFSTKGIDVYRVSPKKTHDAKEVFDGVPSSHDAKAAAIIAWLHLEGNSEKWPVQDDVHRDLKATIGTMDMFDDSYHRNINRLEALTMSYWPELTTNMELKSATLLELLIEYGCPAKVAEDIQQATLLMKKVGGCMLKETKITAVLNSSVTTLGKNCTDAEQEQVKELCREIRRLQQSRRKTRIKLEQKIETIDSIREISPVVGKVTAAVLFVTLGDMNKYDNAGSVLKTLGLNLKEQSSGKLKGALHITKRGSGTARMYLYLAVLRLVQKDKIINAWYQKKIIRDGGKKLKGLIAIMRKLVKALWHVSKGQPFDSSKLFDTSRLSIAQ